MPINYPTSLDTFTNPIPGPPGTGSPITTPNHATQHADANDAIEALEAKVGIADKPVFDPVDYGATGANAVADTAGIIAARDAAAAAGGGNVVVNHDYTVTQQIALKSGVTFTTNAGIGRHQHTMAALTLANGVNASMFYVPLTVYGWRITGGLALFGNSANQSGTSHGIEMEDGDASPNGDARHVGPAISNLYISDFLLDGIHGGRSSAGLMIDNCHIILNLQDGVRLAGDSDHLSNCEVAFNTRYGVLVDGPSAHVTDNDIYRSTVGVRLRFDTGASPVLNGSNAGLVNNSIDANGSEGAIVDDGIRLDTWIGNRFHSNSLVDVGNHAHIRFEDTSTLGLHLLDSTTYSDQLAPTGGPYTEKYDVEIVSATAIVQEINGKHTGQYTTAITNNPTQLQAFLGAAPYVYSRSADTIGGTLRFRKNRSAIVGSHTVTTAGDSLGDQIFEGSDGASYRSAVLLRSTVDTPPSSGIVPGQFSVYTANASGTLTKRIGINSTGSATFDSMPVVRQFSADIVGAQMQHQKSRNATVGGHTVLVAGDSIADRLWQGSDGTAFRTAVLERITVDTTPSAGVVPGQWSIWTANSSGTLVKRLTIDSTGALWLAGVSSGPKLITGAGDPNGTVVAAIGSMYCRTDGGTGSTLYVKESGTGNTGWAAK